MDGEQDATQTEGQQQEQQKLGGAPEPQAGQDAQAHEREALGAEDYEKALAAKDAQIAELQGKVIAAAKTTGPPRPPRR